MFSGDGGSARSFAIILIVHLAVIVLWQVLVDAFQVPKFILPSPLATIKTLASPNYAWLSNLAVTAVEILGGFCLGALVGVMLAVMFTWSPLISLLLLPLFVTLNMIPKVALGPLFIVWFSYGIFPNILIAFSICFFPILLTTARGLSEVEQVRLDFAEPARGGQKDREEADAERDQDVREDTVAEPDDDQRAERDLWNHVQRDEQRQQNEAHQPRPGEDHGKRHADQRA